MNEWSSRWNIKKSRSIFSSYLEHNRILDFGFHRRRAKLDFGFSRSGRISGPLFKELSKRVFSKFLPLSCSPALPLSHSPPLPFSHSSLALPTLLFLSLLRAPPALHVADDGVDLFICQVITLRRHLGAWNTVADEGNE